VEDELTFHHAGRSHAKRCWLHAQRLTCREVIAPNFIVSSAAFAGTALLLAITSPCSCQRLAFSCTQSNHGQH
jgi:hypothetical protein